MIIPDANVLLYAYNPDMSQHAPCRDWLNDALNDITPVGFAWQTLLAFMRIGTHPRVFKAPFSMREATEQVAEWLRLPHVVLVNPGERYWTILEKLVIEAQVTGPLVTDAALAALAIENGATLVSTDRDFTRFKSLKWIDPTTP